MAEEARMKNTDIDQLDCLDKVLLGIRLNKKINLLHGWRPGYFEKSTFLTDAVILGRAEIVAIPLFHWADPQ